MKITQKELNRMLRRTPAKGWCQDGMPQFSLQNYSGLSFRGRKVSYIYFSGSDLSGTDFSKTTIDGTKFTDCNLQNASFQNAKGVNPMYRHDRSALRPPARRRTRPP